MRNGSRAYERGETNLLLMLSYSLAGDGRTDILNNLHAETFQFQVVQLLFHSSQLYANMPISM